CREVFGRKQLRHELHLLDADAMFAGHTAAQANALVEDLVAGHEHALDLFLIALVEQQDWMDIPIAGVKDVGDAKVMPLSDLHDMAENFRQFGAGHNAILSAISRAQPADRAKR